MGGCLPDRGSSHLGISTWPRGGWIVRCCGCCREMGWRRIDSQPQECLLCPAPRNDSRVTNPSLARGQAGKTNMSDVG